MVFLSERCAGEKGSQFKEDGRHKFERDFRDDEFVGIIFCRFKEGGDNGVEGEVFLFSS